MKIRLDFVTNSSSSSFTILKQHLTSKQIRAIHEHQSLGKKLGMYNTNYPWWVSENALMIGASTDMDNFSMSSLLDTIGVNDKFVNWGAYIQDYDEDDEIDCSETKTWEDLLDEV